MPQPHPTPPHSDLDGVAEDEVRNVDAANASGQDARNLELARDQSVGKPQHGDSHDSGDDRSR